MSIATPWKPILSLEPSRCFINPAEEIWDGADWQPRPTTMPTLMLISFHADSQNTAEFGSTMAMDHVEYKFKGKAAHAAADRRWE